MDSANTFTNGTGLAVMKTITGSLALQIQEIGYGFCQGVDTCTKHLNALGVQTLTPGNVAHILAMMIRTHSNLKNGTLLPDTKVMWIDENQETSEELSGWKVENFVQAVLNMVQHLNWNEVIAEFDHPGFAVKDRPGHSLLNKAVMMGLRDSPFPVNIIYTMWTNKEGQLSWIQQILRNADIFCLVDHAHRPVQTVDIVKSTPDESKEIQSWRSLDLIDILLSLGDVPGLSGYVQECLRFPVQSCPELLALGLIQTALPMTIFRQELLVGLFQLLLGGQSKESRLLVFNFALNGPIPSQNQLRQCVLHAMAEWYNRNVDIVDRLTKIFQIAIKLKILLDLLSLPQFQFTIDLACLASRCDYVNLNRWLTEKIQAHGEPFVQSCVQFLKRRFPSLAPSSFLGVDQQRQATAAGGQQLSFDVVSSILALLQSVSAHVQPTLAAEIAKMSGQFSTIAASAPPPPVPAVPPALNAGNGSLPSVGSTPNLAAAAGVIGGAPGRSTATLSSAVGANKYGGAFGTSGAGDSPMFASLNPANFSKAESVPAHLNTSAAVGSMFAGGADFSAHNIFGNPNFQNVGVLGTSSPSTTTGLHSSASATTFVDPLSSLLKPAATGWGAGFGAATTNLASTVMISNARTSNTAAPPSLNVTGVNEPNNPDITQTFAEDIQEEANGYFQQIYTQPPQPSMSIEQFLAVLKRFRDSMDKKELDVFACMIKNLFEEYNFFEQYPEKELHTTALLFGGVVREGLVSGMPLLFALRVVLEALKKDQSSKLYNFGIVAIDQFKARLKEYPRYCQSLIQLPKIQQLQPKILEYIQFGAREEWPTSHQQPGLLTRSQTPASHLAPSATTGTGPVNATSTFVAAPISTGSSKPAPTLNSTNIDTLVHATAKEDSKVLVPSENILEKVAFLFNNLSQMNMNQKVTEMKLLIIDEHMPWLAQYLVMKRVSAESNFHNLYANFVSAVGNRLLNALSLKETYRNIKILLRSDKAAANFSDRTLLKNLGHWLGMSTLMVNKPILHKDLDLKSLLLEAFWKGQQELLYVVPFIAKILESCQKAKVFKPPNPWTKAILSILAELHQQPDLKLNLKFEIEVLFRHLNMELSGVKIINILKDPIVMERAVKVPQLSNPQRLEKPTMSNTLHPSPIPTSAMGVVMSTAMPAVEEHPSVTQTSVTPTPVVARFSYHDIFVNNFQGLIPHISVNASLAVFQFNPPLKNLVKPAIEHAVHELMIPVADRAIKIAMTTTENVIKKDFALDGDENRMRLAAQNMARSLTAGMAMITCRDPLFYGIQGYLKQGFYSSVRGATTEQQRMIEEAVLAITEDNVELAQCFIVKFAAERVCVEIDKRLASEFEARRQARADARPFASTANASAATAALDRLPESVRPRQGAPDMHQLAVYEEFGRQVPGFKPAGIVSSADDLFASTQSSSFQSQAPSHVARHFWPSNASHTEDETIFQQLLRDIETRLQMTQPHVAQGVLACQGVVALREALASASQNPRDTIGAQALLQKLVDIILEFYAPRLISQQQQHLDQGESKEWNILLSEAFLSACKSFTFIFGAQWVQKQVTKTLIDCRQESRFNVDAIELLTRNNLVNMITYDLQLATAMDSGLNYKAVDFAQHLVRRLFVEQRIAHGLSENDLSNTIEMLNRIGGTRMGATDGSNFARQGAMEEFNAGFNRAGPASINAIMSAPSQSFAPNMGSSTVSVLNQLGVTPTSNMVAAQAAAVQQQRSASSAPQPFVTQLESGVMFVREYSGNDPPGLQEKAEYLLREWVEMLRSPAASKDPSKAFSVIVSQMHQHGILKSDDLITRFFRLCTEMSIDLCYRALSDVSLTPSVARVRCFHTLDSFALLIVLLVKHSGDGQHATKVNLLQKILGLIAGTLLQDHKVVRRDEFHQLPYHRLFITLFLDLTAADPLLEPIHMEILATFCQTLHVVQPRYNPGFTFAWLDIIGHRSFIGRVLITTANQKAWSMYAQLLTDHLRFLAPFLRNIEFQKPVALVYVGTLRILLVLLHDLPELLCDYHYALCDVIPPNCVQLRNLILSAYPRNMRLPDPFMINLKVDQLAEINSSPRISVNFTQAIQPASLKNDLDNYVKNRAPVAFLSELRSKLQVSNEPGQKYNISLMNAIVLYVGAQAIQAIQAKEQRPSISTIAHTAHMDIFQNLAVDLDTEGRYLFFNAIANQLRYPNSHTHYFSCTLLYLFAEANSEAIQEQITRILFERLVALRPHPWGLLITFIELIKNPYYKFWSHQFVRCAPEIENLFDSIARSCMVKVTSEAP